jgi:protein-L-isoaspartate(D-aspartate) O-methyltransferase
MSAAYSDCAYQDRLLPIDCGGFAESPDLVARLIVALRRSNRVTGFSIWAPEAVSLRRLQHGLPSGLMTVDRFNTLTQLAQQRFAHLGLGNVVARQADGLKGMSGEGSFDRVICNLCF